jgi:hypothetical protein
MYPHGVKHGGNRGNHARASSNPIPLFGFLHPKLIDIVTEMWPYADISSYEWLVMLGSRVRKIQ